MDINKLTISPEMEAMKNQLIIVLINRLGGDISIPVSEIDAPHLVSCSIAIPPRTASSAARPAAASSG